MNLAGFKDLLASRGCEPAGDGSQFSARCPAHDDKRASLSVSEGDDGRVLAHCHAGCATEAVCAALGVALADLFPTKANGTARRIAATYDYQDASGNLLFQVVRFDPKDFRQRRPDQGAPGGWTWKTNGVRRVLFRLPALLQAVAAGKTICLAEGEKDVLALAEHGFAASCNPGGAGKWADSYSAALKGANVVIVADKDSPGRAHAQLVAGKLHGVAARVRVVELPDLDGKPVKDTADFFTAGGTAEQLRSIAGATPDWVPAKQVASRVSTPGTFAEITAWVRGQILAVVLDRETAPASKRDAIARLVVEALGKVGRFYFHADLRDFDSAMYFDSHRKRLERVRADSFAAWVSEWLNINRADPLFRFILSAVETESLSGAGTVGIVPASFWAARLGAIYLSCGDGSAARITARGVELVDNGTDAVLFAAGRTLAPWKLTDSVDAFRRCTLFRETHCSAAHGPDLLRLWAYSLPTIPRSKPPLCMTGDVGSGKTRTAKGFAELYGLPFLAHKVEEKGEGQFWPCLDQGGMFVLDNADTKTRWLPDAVANAATDGCSQQRKLYTNAETVTLRARAWLVVTTANPSFANDAGLADRLLVVRMERGDDETSDAKLTDEILAARDGGLSHVAETLSRALADKGPTPPRLNARHPDFASFAVRIGRALGREAEAVAALRAAEEDKATFCLENDAVAGALLGYLRQAGSFAGTAAELVPHLVEADAELEGKLSAKRAGKRLCALWPHLEKVLLRAKKEKDGKGFTVFELEAAADRQMAAGAEAPEPEPESEEAVV